MSDLDSSAIRARCEAAKMDGPRLDRMQRALHKAVVAPAFDTASAFDTACFPPPLRTEFQDLLTGYRALLDVNDRLLAEIERLNEVECHAREVMALLMQHGAGIVGHLLDNDDNAGERLRAALATEVKP